MNNNDYHINNISQINEDSKNEKKNIILKPSLRPLFFNIGIATISFILVCLIALILSTIFENYTILTATASVLGYIIFISIVGVIASIIDLYVTKYTITNKNELIITKEFISKTSKVYRIDQITSLERSQTIIQKIFNLHSVEFNIFGGVGVQNTGQSNNRQPILPIFKHIKKGDEVFNEICSRMNISYNTIQILEKPNTKPIQVSIFLNLIATLLLIISSIVIGHTFSPTMSLIPLSLVLIFFLIISGKFIEFLKLKKTNFKLYEESAHIEYSYILKNSEKLTPYRKITNSSEYKNLISYTLFKVSSCVIYTGGNKDPQFWFLDNNSLIIPTISSLVKDPKNRLSKEKISEINMKLDTNKPLFELKPGLSYIVQPIIPISFFIKIFILYLLIDIPYLQEFNTIIVIGSSVYIFLYILFLIYRFIAWNNFNYELYYNKIIIQKGVFNIARSEIYISNIKYISLYRPLYLQRVFSEGTILIYTAGNEGFDGILRRIKNSEYYFEELLHAIKEKS
ncbi:MAG: PH domain-containing protein [Candidatus Woesearchaeota archaeon]